MFDGGDSLFTPRSLSQVLLENLGAIDSRVSFFSPPPLCASVVLCVNIILLVMGKISQSLVDSLIAPFLSAGVNFSFCQLLENPHQA